MRNIIRLDGVHHDEWTLSRDEEQLPDARPAIVPLALWQAADDRSELAPWLPSDTVMDTRLLDALKTTHLIAIDFPAFTDGRGYTLARLLRERAGYTDEICAIGDVLVDQLYYMRRCGFDSFDLREDQDPQDAMRAFESFTVHYQTGTDQHEALFERRLRERQLNA
ncbi:DUF934 domain-containing protein [Larsenimonas rhizosphaerae]|uniref:DUF934 domain-containing protein n=1 Tax=Larsenimonas rhizosphaerae TaxID=2944682 RepID=UPI002034708A|nr:DUF934 domain-containing protein [Larsenimonas rhizosphaerae]MCM2130707.1 DUF934 domain-containing protein [Larsenimonas rhizosphaerae]